MIDGSTDPDCGDNGIPLVDDDFVILINGWWEPLTFTMPADVSNVRGRSCATPSTRPAAARRTTTCRSARAH
jgi:hypothetical protein